MFVRNGYVFCEEIGITKDDPLDQKIIPLPFLLASGTLCTGLLCLQIILPDSNSKRLKINSIEFYLKKFPL